MAYTIKEITTLTRNSINEVIREISQHLNRSTVGIVASGTGSFAGSGGSTTVPIGSTVSLPYRVGWTATGTGTLGEVKVLEADKTTIDFKIRNSGSSTEPFDWWVIK